MYTNAHYYHWYNSDNALRMHYPSESVVGFLKNNVRSGSRVLDLGCGSGRHSILSAELGYDTIGSDLAVKGLLAAKQTAKDKRVHLNLLAHQMADLPFRDEVFDTVVCYAAISGNSLGTQEKISKAIHRVLKPGGLLFVDFYGYRDSRRELAQAKGRRISSEPETYSLPGNLLHPGRTETVPDYLVHFSTPEEIKRLGSMYSKNEVFEIYLPFGNCKFDPPHFPFHAHYAMFKK